MSKDLLSMIEDQIVELEKSIPIHYKDFFFSTQHWPLEQKQVYFELLVYQWDNGGLPIFSESKRKANGKQNESKIKKMQNGQLEIIKKIMPAAEKYWPALRSKFVEVDGFLRNKKLEKVRCTHLKNIELLKIQRDQIISLSKMRSMCGKMGGRGKKANVKQTESSALSKSVYIEDNTVNSSNTNTQKEERKRDKGVGKEKKEGGNKNSKWKQRPGEAEKSLEISETKIVSCVEYIFRLKQKTVTHEDVRFYWKMFKDVHFDGINFYKSESDAYRHFTNSLKFLNFNNPNGIKYQTSSGQKPVIENVDPRDRGSL